MVKSLQANGVPIDGVGLQMHITMNYELFSGVRSNIQRLGALGLQVHITELDVACGSFPDFSCPTWSTTQEAQQANAYKQLMQICYDLKETCTSFETWGFTDRYTWLTSLLGSEQYPLPFDSNYNPKPACDALVQVLTNDSSATCAASATVPPNPADESQ